MLRGERTVLEENYYNDFDEVDDELTDLLLEVSNDNDDDFVVGVLVCLKTREEKKKVIDYIYSIGKDVKKKDIVDLALTLYRIRKYGNSEEQVG